MDRSSMKEASIFWQEIYNSKRIIIYGAGKVCKRCFSLFDSDMKKKIRYIAVSSKADNEEKINDISVYSIDDLYMEKDTTILIAVRNCFVETILEGLKTRGFTKILIATPERINIYQFWKDCGIARKKFDWIDKVADEGQRLEEIYSKTLNIGHFIGSVSNMPMEFGTVSFTWGGSGILDYALLRGLILKYHLRTYLEIGTYIGDSLKCISDLVQTCYSVSVPETHPAHMKNWCKGRHINDYTNKLVTDSNMVQFKQDSKFFDYNEIQDKIDLYFIDGDHSYAGVFIDSVKVFEKLDTENSFVVWHDCRKPSGVNMEIIDAICEAIGEHYQNFYIFDNCMCGIYIPNKYIDDFDKADKTDGLVTYRITLQKNEREL